MINVINKKKWYFAFSAILLLTSVIALALYGLRFSIDFIGGSRFVFLNAEDPKNVEQIFSEKDLQYELVEEGDRIIVRTNEVTQDTREAIKNQVETETQATEESFESVGPVIGNETKVKAVQAVAIAIVAILVYIAIVFRKVTKPVSSWKYGVAAIAALAHDVIIILGMFALLGKFLKVEIDPLFITAILTVMGFSVHDTIVTFDRIRENLRNNIKNIPFEMVVNNSIIETLGRSINTSVTVLFVLVALLLFGGDSIRWFTAALTAGIVVGTYSSIFVASQILVAWREWDTKKKK